MSDEKISEMASAGALLNSDMMPIVRLGSPNLNLQTTMSALEAFIGPIAGGGVVTNVITSSNTTYNLAAVNQQLNIFRQVSPQILSLNLPPSPPTNLQIGVKDGGNNFALFNAVIHTTDGTKIDIVPGSEGFGMNQLGMASWFIFDGVQWNAIWSR